MTRLRARVAERLLQSQSTNAILTTFNEINMAPVMEMRKRMQERFEKEHGVKLGFMSFFVKAAVHALSDALRMELAPFGVRVMEVQPGAIASSFAKNAGHEAEQLISEQSPWFPLREGIRARAKASQDKPTPAREFAAELLKAVQQSKPPRLARIGNGSRALPLLATLLPKGLLESTLMKRFGLHGKL